jgi:2-desacetyl-2-hydroxyethyl bacteriochlorophyllide A dehydrogenase
MIDTVRAAVMTAPHQIKAIEREIKPPGPGEVELQVGYVGLCGTDLHAYQGGSSIFNFPIVFGHEFSAKILRLGKGVTHLEEGQWVGVAPLLSCGGCPYCLAGNNHLCEGRIIFGAQIDGALRERLTMPSETLYPLPSNVSPREGILGEPLAVAVHAVNQAGGNIKGGTATVSGAGAIGLLIALVLKNRGANTIMVLEINEVRRSFAQKLGFQVAHPKDAPTSAVNCLFIATGASEAIAAIPDLLAPHGTAVVAGILSEAPINWLELLFKEASITTSRYFTFQDYQEAIQLLNSPGFKAKEIIQEQVSFSDQFIVDSHKFMSRAQQVLRLVIKM